VGRPLAARTVFTTTRKPVPDWKKARATGGGALLELGSHDFDLVRFLFGGEVAVVQAKLESIEHEQDMARVALRLEGGVTVECLACTCTSDHGILEVHGDRGTLTVDRLRSPVVDVTAAAFDPSARRLVRDGTAALLGRLFRPIAWRGVHPLHSYRNALRAFARAALDGGPCTPDLDDGWRSLAVVAAAEAWAAEAGGAAPVPVRR
jgi:predicted dehydrogenase